MRTWSQSKGRNNDIIKYEAKVPDEFLSRFVAHIRKRSVAWTISRKAIQKNTVITAKTGG